MTKLLDAMIFGVGFSIGVLTVALVIAAVSVIWVIFSVVVLKR